MYRMTTPNPASNFANLASLTPSFLSYVTSGSPVQNYIQTFLTAPDQTTYDPMVSAIVAARTALATGTNATLRTLLAASDGRVAYDSTKSNTWANYTSSTLPLGENHNTRPEIMLAVLSSGGVGLSDRYSSTAVSSQKYQATRLGDSTNNNLGTLRLSMNNYI